MDKLECDKTCLYEDSNSAQISKLQCQLQKENVTNQTDLKACQKEREELQNCDMTCKDEDPKDAQIFKLQCHLTTGAIRQQSV